MVKKQILIDLSDLKSNPSCGFAQIAVNYAKLFSQIKSDTYEFVFLVQQQFVGAYGDNVKYEPITKKSKFPFLLPTFDIWHSTNQRNKILHLDSHTKRVFTIHDINFFVEKIPLKVLKYRYKLQKQIDKSTAVTFISQYTADEVNKYFDLSGKITRVIYNGVERIDLLPAIQPDFVRPSRPFFFTIGQIRAKKNFHRLLDIMPAFPDHDLYICGDDDFSYAQQIRQAIADKKLKNVFLTGKVKDYERVWLYKNCEAFLFPSTLEGFGLPVLEAMQFGRPVFSSNCTSLPEICGSHAFIWDNFDPEYMIDSMKRDIPLFYNNADMINEAKQYAYSFSYEKNVNAYRELYESLLH